MSTEALVKFKEAQKQAWGLFAPLEIATTMPAASLVKFAQIRAGETVLDVATGTGVVAVTAARLGARVSALDLSPKLLERARVNADLAKVEIPFVEGDVEALPYKDASFDVVTSQFGHMFAPRPEIAIKEMLRVLKPGGKIAFSTWPPEHFVGQMFALQSRYVPPPPGVAPPPQWGDPNSVRERLGAHVTDLMFDRGTMRIPTLSTTHFWEFMQPVMAIVTKLADDPAKLGQFRSDMEKLATPYLEDNHVRQIFLMTRARKV